jgi:hypothetical protein
MKALLRAACALAVLLPLTALAAPKKSGPAGPAPVEVMIVGNFHMSNPGRDMHNAHVDDVLAPKRQKEIAAAVDGLNRFHPTVVAAEWPADVAAERYAKYAAGTLAPSHNEVVQLGFRLAKTAGLKEVHGIDVEGDFPFEPVDAYAKAHGQASIVRQLFDEGEATVKHQEQMLKTSTVSGVLRDLNDPANIARSQNFYRATMQIGGGKDQPGAELMTAWYHRNFLICANLIQLAKPGDRVVVFYGAGHAFLLRQCVAEMPGFKLVEPNAYLPR